MKTAFYQSPIGMFKICEDKGFLVSCEYTRKRGVSDQSSLLKEAMGQLDEYFSLKRTRFNLPLRPLGTKFQQDVWKALRRIPYGKTRTYGDIAREVKNPKACRAVGNANGKNPLSIIVPCHRVVGKHPQSGGFGMGMKKKTFLLNLEG